MTPRFLWRLATVAYALPAIMLAAVWKFQLAPNPIPDIAVIAGGLVPLCFSVVWSLMGRRGVDPYPWFHLALVVGCVVLLIPPQVDNNSNSADAVYQLLPAILAIILFPIRQTLLYALFAVGGSALLVATGGDATPVHRAITSALVAAAVLAIIGVGQHRLGRALRRNRELSEYDELTGALNMRALRDRLNARIAAERDTSRVGPALISLDLNGFKSVNDTFGHSVGDRMLVDVAQAIEAQLGQDQQFARRGGDEFLIVAPDLDHGSALRLAGRVERAVTDARLRLCPELAPGAGVAVIVGRGGESTEELLARADDALHDAKSVAWRLPVDDREEPVAETSFRQPLARIGSLASVASATDSEASYDLSVRRTSWRLLAAYFFLLASTPLLGIAGRIDGFTGTHGMAIAVIGLAFAGVCGWAGRRPLSGEWQGLGLSAAILATAAVTGTAGPAANAMIDFFMIPAALACCAFAARAAIAFVVIAMGSFGYFLAATPMPELHGVRFVQTGVVVGILFATLPGVVARGRRLVAENERLTDVDPLTGVANVRAMRSRILHELSRLDEGRKLSLLALDLDNFKLVNDRFGHTTGDQLLRAVAQAIKGAVREQDLVARRGGDEFVVVIAHDKSFEPGETADRAERAIVECRREVCGGIAATASIGCVTATADDSFCTLLARADQSEQQSKLRARANGLHLRAI